MFYGLLRRERGKKSRPQQFVFFRTEASSKPDQPLKRPRIPRSTDSQGRTSMSSRHRVPLQRYLAAGGNMPGVATRRRIEALRARARAHSARCCRSRRPALSQGGGQTRDATLIRPGQRCAQMLLFTKGPLLLNTIAHRKEETPQRGRLFFSAVAAAKHNKGGGREQRALLPSPKQKRCCCLLPPMPLPLLAVACRCLPLLAAACRCLPLLCHSSITRPQRGGARGRASRARVSRGSSAAARPS